MRVIRVILFREYNKYLLYFERIIMYVSENCMNGTKIKC